MANYRLILSVMFIVTSLNLMLYWAHQKGNSARFVEPSPSYELPKQTHLAIEAIHKLLQQVTPDQDRLFVIEPSVLGQALDPDQLSDLKWRFDLPDFGSNSSCTTLGMFDGDQVDLSRLSDVVRVEGVEPFGGEKRLLHLFGRWQSVKVHVVIFHRVKHFLWIGQIPDVQLSQLRDTKVLFGIHEAIYDPFGLTKKDSVLFPDEVGHFLSQLPTSRYMHCPVGRQDWLKQNNILYDFAREKITIQSIVSIKSLMKEQRMEFWAMCGTLLGWYRQCGPIPYTTDNDFSTWPKYLQGQDLAPQLRKYAPRHNLRLFYRFGEPYHSMEYSFKTLNNKDKVDMFFTYRNSTHFLLPFHVAWKHVYQYSIYPQYELCSMELLGYKLLAPCQAEKVLLTEYGPNWDRPKKEYDYAESPFNSGPQYPFPRNMSQYTQY